MKTVTTGIPEDVDEALSELEERVSADRFRRLNRRGLSEWRKETALDKLRDHGITVRRAVDFAGVTYVGMLSLAAEEGIDVGYMTEDRERDFERFCWSS